MEREVKPFNNDFPVIDTFQRPRLPEGTLIHKVNVYPPCVFRVTNVTHLFETISFDAICVESEERIQGYELDRTKSFPDDWRILTNELEILAVLSMSRAEWWSWYQNYRMQFRYV